MPTQADYPASIAHVWGADRGVRIIDSGPAITQLGRWLGSAFVVGDEDARARASRQPSWDLATRAVVQGEATPDTPVGHKVLFARHGAEGGNVFTLTGPRGGTRPFSVASASVSRGHPLPVTPPVRGYTMFTNQANCLTRYRGREMAQTLYGWWIGAPRVRPIATLAGSSPFPPQLTPELWQDLAFAGLDALMADAEPMSEGMWEQLTGGATPGAVAPVDPATARYTPYASEGWARCFRQRVTAGTSALREFEATRGGMERQVALYQTLAVDAARYERGCRLVMPPTERFGILDRLAGEGVIKGWALALGGDQLLINIGPLRFEGPDGALYELTPCVLRMHSGDQGSQLFMEQEDGNPHPHPHARLGGAGHVCWGERDDRDLHASTVSLLWQYDPEAFIHFIRGFLVNQTAEGRYPLLHTLARRVEGPPRGEGTEGRGLSPPTTAGDATQGADPDNDPYEDAGDEDEDGPTDGDQDADREEAREEAQVVRDIMGEDPTLPAAPPTPITFDPEALARFREALGVGVFEVGVPVVYGAATIPPNTVTFGAALTPDPNEDF